MKTLRKGRIISLVLSVVLLLSITGCTSNLYTKADFPYYNDVDSLTNESDVIVYGKIIKVNDAKEINISGDKDKEHKVEYTISDVEIVDVIKGDVEVGDVIQVKQLGNENEVANAEVKMVGYFKKDMEYIFFLKSFEDIIPDMPYSTLSPYQGHISIADDKATVNKENKLFKDNTSKKELIDTLKEKVKTQK